jgi:hypothetical protein
VTTPRQGLFHSPSPLPGGAVLVSRRTASTTHGVYSLDPESGRYELLFDDPAVDEIQAKAVVPREMPDGRASVVDEKEDHGALYCLSVYTSDMEIAPGSVKRLRVLTPGGTFGDVAVWEDGSFHVQVPANTPIRLQTLGAGGAPLRTIAWIWVKNKENRGCIGCHEDGELSPPNVLADALTHPAARLPGGERKGTIAGAQR